MISEMAKNFQGKRNFSKIPINLIPNEFSSMSKQMNLKIPKPNSPNHIDIKKKVLIYFYISRI